MGKNNQGININFILRFGTALLNLVGKIIDYAKAKNEKRRKNQALKQEPRDPIIGGDK